MATPRQSFRAAQAEQIRNTARLYVDSERELARMLQDAKRRVQGILADAPSEFSAFHYNQIQQQLRDIGRELNDNAVTAMNARGRDFWQAGKAFVTDPLQAAGLIQRGAITAVNPMQLQNLKNTLTWKMANVTTGIVDQINQELAQAVLGVQSPYDVIRKIGDITGSGLKRGTVVMRTELARTFSAANQQYMSDAARVVPGLRKKWLSSNKIHSRPTHDKAHGQIVGANEYFLIENEKTGLVDRLMYPRDPSAPPEQTINCGCTSVPVVDF